MTITTDYEDGLARVDYGRLEIIETACIEQALIFLERIVVNEFNHELQNLVPLKIKMM